MSTRTIKEYKRAAYERLAQQYEANDGRSSESRDGTEFTCIAVTGAIGYADRLAYQEAFGLEHRARNVGDLWRRSWKGQTNLRVLLLCFAAAMVATGDL